MQYLQPRDTPQQAKVIIGRLVEWLRDMLHNEQHRASMFRYIVSHAFERGFKKEVVVAVCEAARPLAHAHFEKVQLDLFATTIHLWEAKDRFFPWFIQRGKWDRQQFDAAMAECGIQSPPFKWLDDEDILGFDIPD